MAKHFALDITETTFACRRKADAIAAEVARFENASRLLLNHARSWCPVNTSPRYGQRTVIHHMNGE